MFPEGLLDRQLVWIAGKGGTGRSTVAMALATALAEAGRRTVVCEFSELSEAGRLLDRPVPDRDRDPGQDGDPLERRVGERLWAVTIDPQVALRAWVGRQAAGGALVGGLTRSPAFAAFVAAAPGVTELISIARVWELLRTPRWDPDDRHYDVAVVDGPASGHALAMLSTPRTFADVAGAGPIRRQAERVLELIGDPQRTAVVGITRADRLPVAETLELDVGMRVAIGRGLDGVIVNAVPDGPPGPTALAALQGVLGQLPADAHAARAAVTAAMADADAAAAADGWVSALRRELDPTPLVLGETPPHLSAADGVRLLARQIGARLEAPGRG